MDNPYESPRGIDATSGLVDDRVLTATFFIDDAWRADTARMLTRPQDVALGATFAAIVLASAAFGTLVTAWSIQPGVGLLGGMFVGLVVAFAVTLPLAFLWQRSNRFHRLSKFPLGVCKVQIDTEMLTVTCGDDGWTYPLKSVRHAWVGKAVVFRVAKSDDRFLIRQSADFGDDDYTSWRLAVFKRIKIL